MPLTVNQVKNAKPGRHSDGGGLYLLVKPSRSKSWVLRVQLKGHRRDFGIGSAVVEKVSDDSVPVEKRKQLTLTEAREKARLGRAIAKSGINPVTLWGAEEEEVPTLKEAAETYHANAKQAWRNGKHQVQWLSTLEAYAYPLLGKVPVDVISADDVFKALVPIWLEKPETARRVKQRIGAVLDFSHAKGWRPADAPMRALNQLLKALKQKRGGNFASMPWDKIPAFWRKLNEGDPSIGKWALQFLILTTARSGEIRKAKWRDIDMEAAEWLVPPLNVKTDKPHLVPLPPAALSILKAVREVTDHKPDDFVFPGMKGKMMSDATMAKALRVAGGDDYTVHGFRSSFTDWGAETGQPDAWVDKALGHKLPDKVDAAYRRTTYFQQRRDRLMPAWADYVEGPDNLISLAERRA
ncbi:MAG: tyrosine-type recombinase/integrase [Pseudomonadota bacterium]|nr:tyrosine-type recombinase/integrase [Pseudomonadota bacterium]